MPDPARRPARAATLAATLAGTVAASLVLGSTPAQAAPGGSSDSAADRIARHSLRGALTDTNFYFVMGDRFNDGDPDNNDGGLSGDKSVTGYDPADKAYYHGGDIEGLQAKLDYLEGMGTEAIWFTPIFKNKPVQPEDGPSAGYHGYWITDFTQVDPHLGTNDDLKALVDDAHDRGMKVFFDIITNHTADVISYESNAREGYTSKDVSPYRDADGTAFDDREYAGTNTFPELDADESFPYLPRLTPEEQDLKVPGWLNDVRYYHNRGNTDFQREDEDQQYGDFAGLDDLFTEHPRVVKGMKQIYKTWVSDIGIDGYRIDTMKHVDDAFWQDFGPGVLRYARNHGKPDFFMFGEVYDDRPTAEGKAFTSKFVTRDKMQAILDFPFQGAARNFVSRGQSGAALRDFFVDDDYYTDKDSNAYQLPTFLGNHDMGRIGSFLKQDNPGASDDELLARAALAHELMYLVRGNPVVYYGDEQGFTGSGGDQLARQDMFANAVAWPDGYDEDHLGTDEGPDDDNFDVDHPLYEALAGLDTLTERHPALRNGAMQVRTAGEQAFAFSRIDREKRREYVVVVNAGEQRARIDVPTYVPGAEFRRVHGEGASTFTTRRAGVGRVVAEPLSAVVYRATERMPLSRKAPSIDLTRVKPSPVDVSRTEVRAGLGRAGFHEVTFQAKVGSGGWQRIGTDDNAPYRVFHDTAALRTGTRVLYRAVVLDNDGHTRMSGVRRGAVPSPTVRVVNPGARITGLDPVLVEAQVNPERTTQRVRFERRVGTGAWEGIGVDRSSPWYSVRDDSVVGLDLPVGTRVRYRAVLLEPGSPTVTSPTAVSVVSEPEPAYDTVTLAGSLQSELGCTGGASGGDWLPDCAATHLEFDPTDGTWDGRFTLPAGTYEWKIATNDSWTENYGQAGASNGANYSLVVPDGGATYDFSFNQSTKLASATPVPGP